MKADPFGQPPYYTHNGKGHTCGKTTQSGLTPGRQRYKDIYISVTIIFLTLYYQFNNPERRNTARYSSSHPIHPSPLCLSLLS